MKNMKIRAKLFTGFIFVTILGILLGVVGIVSISMIRTRTEDIASLQEVSSGASSVLNAHYIWRHNLTEAVLTGGDFTGSLDPNGCALGRWLASDEARSITDPEILDLLRQTDAPHRFIHTEAALVVASIEEGNLAEATRLLVEAILPRTQEVISLLTDVETRFDDIIDGLNLEILDLESVFIYIIIGVIAVAAVISMFLAFYISNQISKPLAPLTAFMTKAGTVGDLTLRPEDVAVIAKFAEAKDEIGQTIGSCATFVKHVTDISEQLARIASGDLTTEVKCLSNDDALGVGLRTMVDSMNDMFSEINESSAQVSSGSKQIADGAQSLAQGSTQQAATVEALSKSIVEIAEKTKDNAEMANRTATLANTIMQNAQKGSGQMDEMTAAVREINQASQSISKVIKVIDDIAFQTNILALNAAVEAARAGQHGKGFAVVAEEVRNLAAKSAEAAKDTGGLIANSMEKAELGARIADDTAASLTEIVSGINESNQLITEIAGASEVQSEGIAAINISIDQVAQVVQQNSATAEESAAASEEMSGQADTLQHLISRFKLKSSGSFNSLPSARPPQHNTPAVVEDHSYTGLDDTSGFGKY
ncbi:MAG: methyl-accepting chemotaxis protein [Oscillospiraceae bacterium]|nr:methyl-accepting chemotaxis protein [Oscillospiraceae bacterium]